jgi:hypothetical protein
MLQACVGNSALYTFPTYIHTYPESANAHRRKQTYERRLTDKEGFTSLVALACDRYYDDRDNEMWGLIANQEGPRDAMVHMGDQVRVNLCACLEAFKNS